MTAKNSSFEFLIRMSVLKGGKKSVRAIIPHYGNQRKSLVVQTVQDPQSRLPPLCPYCAHLNVCELGTNFYYIREIFLLSQFLEV